MLPLCRGCSLLLRSPTLKRLLSTSVDKIRNIGVIAHVDAGKTTITEQILLKTGAIKAAGRVDRGSTMTDYLECEQDHGITVNSASVQCQYKGYTLNIIDTPGHIDFNVEVERCMRVLDGSVLVLDATAGVQAQTSKVFSQIKRFKVPAFIMLNKFDRPNASFSLCLDSIREQLHVSPLALHYPLVNEQGVLTHIGSVLRKEEYDITTHNTGPLTDLRLHTHYRTRLVESLADVDEELGDEYLIRDGECEEIEDEMLDAAVKRAMMRGDGVPICLGSGLKGYGISICLEMITSYLPSPLYTQQMIPSALDKLCGIVYKATLDPSRGLLCQARIYSGRLKQSERIYNYKAKTKEIVSRIYRQDAGALKEIEECSTGDLVVLAGCKHLRTGDLFVEQSFVKRHKELVHCIKDNLMLNTGIQITDPVFYARLQCESIKEQERAEKSLAQMAFEDPTLVVKAGVGGDIVLGGSGELHLMIAHERLVQEHRIDCVLQEFQVSYKEMVMGAVVEYYDIATNDEEAPLVLKIVIAPHTPNQAQVSFFSKEQEEHVTMVTANALLGGPLVSLPLINTSIHVSNVSPGTLKGQFHVPLNTKDLVKQVMLAVRGAMKGAHVALAEPSSTVSVQGPRNYCNVIEQDFNTRHGDIQDIKMEMETFTLTGSAPLSQLIGYSSRVRSLGSGRVNVEIDPVSGYDALDDARTQDVISKIRSGEMCL